MTDGLIESAIPGGILATDTCFVGTHDGTCSRCRQQIPEETVPLLLWSQEDPNRMWAYCPACTDLVAPIDADPYDAEPELGTCCRCQGVARGMRNVLLLPYRAAPAPGEGGRWGCLVCDLPMEGAVAVVCDRCLHSFGLEEPPFVCVGEPARNQREPIEAARARGAFDHDPSKHPGLPWPEATTAAHDQ